MYGFDSSSCESLYEMKYLIPILRQNFFHCGARQLGNMEISQAMITHRGFYIHLWEKWHHQHIWDGRKTRIPTFYTNGSKLNEKEGYGQRSLGRSTGTIRGHNASPNLPTLLDCRIFLNEMTYQFNIHHIWLPDNGDYPGNGKAGGLIGIGTPLQIWA